MADADLVSKPVIRRLQWGKCRMVHAGIESCRFSPRWRVALVFFAAAWGSLAGGDAAAGVDAPLLDESGARLVRLEVLPSVLRLGGRNRRQQLLISAYHEDGRIIDVTRQASVASVDPNSPFARAVDGFVQGVANGRGELIVRWSGAEARVPIKVDGIDQAPPVHFRNDVIPLFSKLGCNSGGCHGKASGQNGFKLSVFGHDPTSDYQSLVSEARGRRMFPGDPSRSLLYLKGTGGVPHGGGRRIASGSADERLLIEWLEQAMPWGDDRAPTLAALRVEPSERVLDVHSEQQILATAVFSDGSTRDVSGAAHYASNAPTIADMTAPGLIHTGAVPGEAAITVNYMGQVAAVQIQVPRRDASRPSGEYPIHNAVDPLVWSKLRRMGIVPSELADDATFLRRVSLDTIGVLPTVAEVRSFLLDESPDKRRRLIDALLERGELADLWALKWADILLVDRKKLGDRGAYEFHRWLRNNMARNRPYDVWVRELITATGNSGKVGPVNFFRAQRAPEELARSVSQALLGIRLDCAQCHHHPFDRWGQEDFYGLAGYFGGLTFQPLPGDADRELISHAGFKETRMPLTGEVVATKPPGGAAPDNLAAGDPRVPLAAWMTARENPFFARLAANRVWKHFLGRGLIEPEDDLRGTNPATNEPLLRLLTEELIERKFDLKALMRLILNSRVYQLSSATNDTNADDEQNFSHYTVKRMPAEVLMDAVSRVTEVAEEFPGLPRGTRATELWDNRFPSYFLEIFGRPERNTPCECGRSNEPTLSQALHLMNAPEIDAKIRDPRGRLARLSSAGASRDAMVEELCLAALARLPSEKERLTAETLFSQSAPREAAEDFLWALLNSYDFLFVK